MYAMNESMIRAKMCEIGKKIWQRGYVPANAGNICVKIGENEYLATPTNVSKAELTPDMILRLLYEPEKPEEERITVLESMKPFGLTSEIRVHLVALQTLPDCAASIHAHCPYCQVYSMTGRDAMRLPDNFAGIRYAPIAPWVHPGTWELAYNNVDALLKTDKRHGIIMEKHGPLVLASDLEEAYMLLEDLEHSAKVGYMLEMMNK